MYPIGYFNNGYFGQTYFQHWAVEYVYESSSSSSSTTPVAPVGPAFTKACAPQTPSIGPYRFVDDCRFPTPPDPVWLPIDTTVPVPPIDVGCYPLSVSGTYSGPHSERSPAGVSARVIYPDGDPCNPLIDIDFVMPCPTGGEHRSPVSGTTFPAWLDSRVMSWRQSQYVAQYGASASSLPYFSLIPKGSMMVNTDLGFIASSSLYASSAFGRIVRMEFDSSCDIQYDLSLYIPCGPRAPKFEFYDITQWGTSSPTPLAGYSVSVKQDWAAAASKTDCLFDEVAQLFITPATDGGVVAMLTGHSQWGSVQRWKYDWQPVRLNKDGTVTVTAGGGSVGDGKYAINLFECLNLVSRTGIQGNGINEAAGGFPSLFSLWPADRPGNLVVRLFPTAEWDSSSSVYSTRMTFMYNNAEDVGSVFECT